MADSLDRQSLLRHGGLVAAGAAGAAAVPLPQTAPTAAAAPAKPHSQVTELTTRNPLIEQRADPFITHPVRGMYYMTGSVPEYDRIVVRGAPTIEGLAHTRERTIWRRPDSGRMGGYVWAPELHHIDGRWYVYFAAGDADDKFRIRMYVLESAAADPREDAWVLRGQITTAWDTFALDGTTFEHRGKRYYAWAQHEPGIDTNSNLYIAEMSSPLAIKGDPVRIAVPTHDWETRGFAVNEGAAVLVRNGRVFMSFSASATDANYCMGLLTADARANLLDPASWNKSPQPVFTTNENTGRFGPGHNMFTVGPDGESDVLVYHCRDYRHIEGDPLFDPNRHTRVQRLYWNDDGTPAFGVPVGEGGTIVRLSPMDTPRSYVRHYDYRLRVDGDVRRLADSQFRFVPGFLGPDRVALQSVNFPDRYVRVRGDSLHIDPYQDSDDYGRSTGFVRTPGLADRRGVSLRLPDSPDAYLVHDNGRLRIGHPRGRSGREQATFLLS